MLKAILAISADGCIDVPTPKVDRDRFAMLTTGGDCVCGRTTWDTLPPAARRNRNWLVFTRRPISQGWKIPEGEPRLEADIEHFIYSCRVGEYEGDWWVCGGREIYDQMIPDCHMLYLTKLKVGGGTLRPNLDLSRYDSLFSRDYGDHTFEILRTHLEKK